MQPSLAPPRYESSAACATSNNERQCPMCGGAVFDAKMMVRCVRCSFVTCAVCEGRFEELAEEG
jgi:hypothetical protein